MAPVDVDLLVVLVAVLLDWALCGLVWTVTPRHLRDTLMVVVLATFAGLGFGALCALVVSPALAIVATVYAATVIAQLLLPTIRHP